MRTIGKHWKYEIGVSRSARCDICGAMFPRVELRTNADGVLVCAEDDTGRCNTELMDDKASCVPEPRQPCQDGALDTENNPDPALAPAEPTTRAGLPLINSW